MDEEKKKQAPKCDLRWEEDHFVVECDTPEDRDLAAKALEEAEIVVRVKVKKEIPDKK
jgi:hypothetical protein